MINKIIITKNKILYKFLDANLDKPKYRIVEIKPEDLIYYLYEHVALYEVTLKRIFDIIASNKYLWGIVLNEKIELLLLEANTPCKEKTTNNSNLLFLELSWEVIYDNTETEDIINISPNFYGFGLSTKKDGIYYAVGLIPIVFLKNLAVKLKENFEINYFLGIGTSKKFGKRYFTVLDLMKGVLSELTFYGTVQDKNRIMAEIHQETVK